MTFRLIPLIALALFGISIPAVSQAEDQKPRKIDVGKLQFQVPDSFQSQRPRSQIIAHEFSIPAAKGDERPGRMTVMSAGGSIQQNIDRWLSQFSQPDGGNTRDHAKIEETEINEREVHFVDLSGTYDDKPGPFAPGEKRENYRMLGAIIPTPEGTVYFKFYGPRKTVTEHLDDFRKMIVDGLKSK